MLVELFLEPKSYTEHVQLSINADQNELIDAISSPDFELSQAKQWLMLADNHGSRAIITRMPSLQLLVAGRRECITQEGQPCVGSVFHAMQFGQAEAALVPAGITHLTLGWVQFKVLASFHACFSVLAAVGAFSLQAARHLLPSCPAYVS
jgi:hypothetical protein